MRLFTAIDLPSEMLEKLQEFLVRLRPLAKLRWSPVENLHITTKFIGEWPEARIEEMETALRGVTYTGPISISVHGVGWFPDGKRPRVFWVGVEAGDPLKILAKSTDEAISKLGIPFETRPYAPHLTLARVKDATFNPCELRAAAGSPDFGAFQASSFFLYRSSGGKYSKLAEFSLHS